MKRFRRICLIFAMAFIVSFAACNNNCKKKCNNDPVEDPGTTDIFENESSSYVLEKDYSLSKEVKLTKVCVLDLNGHSLDLAGYTFSIQSNEDKCQVTLKNGVVKNGKLAISVPNGDIDFDKVTINDDVNYELEAASKTIRFSNANLNGKCTVVSNTHVEIAGSTVKDIVLTGNGSIYAGGGTSLGNLEISAKATGATVNVDKNAVVTGGIIVNAQANVMVSGEVAKLDVQSAAQVVLNGKVDEVVVANNTSNVTVGQNGLVSKVQVESAATVVVEGFVASVVVGDKADDATIDVKNTAQVVNVLINANNTTLNVEDTSSIQTVKQVETVTGTTLPDNLDVTTVTKDEVEEMVKHTHSYKTTSKVEATCTTDGKEVYTCSTCNDIVEITKPSLKHDYQYEILKAPTETAEGIGRYTCSKCNDSYEVKLPYEQDMTLHIENLDELLKMIFNEGLSIQSNKPFLLGFGTNDRLSEGGSSSLNYYTLNWLSNFNLKLDLSDGVKLQIDIVACDKRVSELTHTDLETLTADNTYKITIYVENDIVYAYTDTDLTVAPNYTMINLSETIHHMANNNLEGMPQVIKYMAKAIEFVSENGIDIVNVNAVKQKINAFLEQYGNINLDPNTNKIVQLLIENLFTKTTDGTKTTYTLDFDKAILFVANNKDKTIATLLDEIMGQGTSTALIEKINTIPSLTMGTLANVILDTTKELGMTEDQVYGLVENIMKAIGMNLPEGTNVKDFVKEYSYLTLAHLLAAMNNIPMEQATQNVNEMIQSVVAMIQQAPVDQVLTQLLQMVQPSNPGDGTVQPTEPVIFSEMLTQVLTSMKKMTALSVSMDAGKTVVTVTMGDQTVALNVDETNGLTIEGLYNVAEQMVAKIIASFTDTTINISGSAMGYDVSVEANTQEQSFDLVVEQLVEDKKQELVKFNFVAVENGFNVNASFMGTEIAKGTLSLQNGVFELNIPVNGTVMPVKVTTRTINNVTIIQVEMNNNGQLMAVQVKLDNSKENHYLLTVEVGSIDASQNFVSQAQLASLELTIENDENQNVKKLTVDYVVNVDALNYEGSFTITLNSKTSVDDKTKDEYNEIVSDLKKLSIWYYDEFGLDSNYFDLNVWYLEYHEDEMGPYYILKLVTQQAENLYDEVGHYFYGNETYAGRINQTIYISERIDAKDGLFNGDFFSVREVCNDWYRIQIEPLASVTKITSTLEGEFVREKGIFVFKDPKTGVTADVYEEPSSEMIDFDCYYNKNTKKCFEARNIDEVLLHNYKYSAELVANATYCDEGIHVHGVCQDCNDVVEFVKIGCFETGVNYFADCTLGDHLLYERQCVYCGEIRSGFSNFMGGNVSVETEYVSSSTDGETFKTLVNEITALGFDTTGIYFVKKGTWEVKCSCEFGGTQYEWYTKQEGEKCIFHSVKLHTDKAGKTVKVQTLSHDTHNCINLNGDLTDPTQTYKDLIASINWNKYVDLVFTRGSFEKSVCLKGDYISSETYVLYSDTVSLRISLSYDENGNLSHFDFDYDFSEPVEIYSLINEYQLGIDFSSLTNVKGVGYNFSWSKWSNYSQNTHLYLYLENHDIINMDLYSNRAEVSWEQYSTCSNISYIYNYKNGGYVLEYQQEGVCHHMAGKSNDHCVEDGYYYQCVVCGYGEGEPTYQHQDYKYHSTNENLFDGMSIEYTTYSCCDTLKDVYITLQNNVVLTHDVYIAAESIDIDFNGYSIDLNGYNLILYGYKTSDNSTSVGMYSSASETKSQIFNSKKTENPNATVVVCVNGGAVVNEGIDIIDCLIYTSDTVSRKELAAAVAQDLDYNFILPELSL